MLDVVIRLISLLVVFHIGCILMSKAFLEQVGKTVLLMGNEAVARGAVEAGISFASAYPGTPSTEIVETLARYANVLGIHVEWSTNEKVAFEAAYGAAMSGVRALTCMKHVGLNVAADPFMSSAYTGVRGGFVIVTADDVGMWSSQNEQDNRWYGLHAFIPVFEPYSPAEAKELTKEIFDFSENFEHPVILRTTTRISHARGPVQLGKLRKPVWGEFTKNAERWVIVPAHARKLRLKLLKRWSKIEEAVNNFPFNRIENPGSKKVIIACGITYGHVVDVLREMDKTNDVTLLKLSSTVPVPRKLVVKAVEDAEEVLVVEELEPIVEDKVKAILQEEGISAKVHGKDIVPRAGELTLNKVADFLVKFLNVSKQSVPWLGTHQEVSIEVPPRPPTLCPGCPHRATFFALKKAVSKLKMKPVYLGDIGCYTLGVNPPYRVQDTCIEMGGSIGAANGLAVTTKQPMIAIIGDSTFFHAGIPPLINAVYNNTPFLTIILDNRTTAMTGHQPHPGTGMTASGGPAKILRPENIAKSIGVEYIDVVNPFKLDEAAEKIAEALKFVEEKRKPAVIVSSRKCALLVISDARRKNIKIPVYRVNLEKCTACTRCYNVFACPAIQVLEDGKAYIDPMLCAGCGDCAQVCPVQAIEPTIKPGKEWEELWW